MEFYSVMRPLGTVLDQSQKRDTSHRESPSRAKKVTLSINCQIFYSIVLIIITESSFIGARAQKGNWQLQRNRNFRKSLTDGVEHMELNGAAQFEETATQFAED
jgi:hypothetical protein